LDLTLNNEPPTYEAELPTFIKIGSEIKKHKIFRTGWFSRARRPHGERLSDCQLYYIHNYKNDFLQNTKLKME